MKSAVLLWPTCVMLAAVQGAPAVQQRPEPFVPVAVSYRIELSRDGARASADLEAIQALGFNSLRVPVGWSAIEPARGKYQFEALNRTLELAGQAGLRVALRLDATSSPDWLLRRYPDGRFVAASKRDGAEPGNACLDHPGVRAAVVAYVAAVTAHAARQSAWHAIDLGSDLPDGVCLCPHTERRFREWLTSTFGSEPRSAARAASDRAAFVALRRADHLALLAAAASARSARSASSSARASSVLTRLLGEPPGQDDWLMTTVVDQYGTLVPPETSSASSLTPARLAFALDGMRSATRDKGWLMSDRTIAGGATPVPSAADLRLWTWAAFSRGARGVTYADWRAPGPGTTGLVNSDGTISERARAAGGLARVIGRNPALFAPLRPRPAKVAIIYDPRRQTGKLSGVSAASALGANIYRAFFDRNIQVDFIHLDEIAAGAASRYAVVVAHSESTLPKPVAEALKAYVGAGGILVDASKRSTTGEQVVQIAARAGVSTDVRIEGATGPVETRFLESSDILMLIGLNHADTPQRVKMTFTPDTQEAIWQNMETGSAVNFIAGPEGPTYTYSFGPRDALVLMIRKSMR